MQRLVDAIDKGVSAGVYTLQETSEIINAIEQISNVLVEWQNSKDKIKEIEVKDAKEVKPEQFDKLA